MYYYKYNEQSVITEKLSEQPETGNYAMSENNFDLLSFDIVIGAIDENNVIIYHTPRYKPIAELVKNIIAVKQENAELSETVIGLMDVIVGGAK